MHKNLSTSRGFTLIELVVVISIMVTLLSMGFFPFRYYAERAKLERNLDMLSQEWRAAQEEVKNGLLSDANDSGSTQAHLFVTFEKGKSAIEIESASGATFSRKHYKTISLDRPIEILGFSGTASTNSIVTYHISPPFATGGYMLDTPPEITISTGIIMLIGYP
jgi:prepilin-type N-terminal cleavage/methylation domain-containing protein